MVAMEMGDEDLANLPKLHVEAGPSQALDLILCSFPNIKYECRGRGKDHGEGGMVSSW